MNKNKLTALIITALCLTSTIKVSAAPSVKRIYGQTRYETAASICKEGWKEKSNYAIVVNGENFPDAITAAPLAAKYKAPILLTPKNELSPFTSVELKRLGVKNVFIIGGKGVIYQNVEDGIKSMGIKVTRLGGQTRYETALLVAGKVGKSNQVAVVDGTSFGDAVSIAPIAALKQMPIILAQKNYIPDDVMKYLQKQKKAEQVYVIGGRSFLNDNLVKKIPNSKRIAEGGMYEKNIQIINAFKNELNLNNLYIASGKDYADALAGSALAAQNSEAILLVDSNMPEPSKRFLQSQVINEIGVLGGPGVVNSSVIQSSKDLPLEVADANNVVKNIYQNEEFTPPKTMIITASDNSKKEMPVNWNLKKIDTTKPGIYTFKGSIEDYDKDVILTLIVKPIPDKINDIKAEAETRSSYTLPETVTATMSDGSLGDVDVSWDYGTQKKPGIYEFLGTVNRYSKKVKLTLTIKNDMDIQNIKDIKKIFNTRDDKDRYNPPSTVIATMKDGTTKRVTIRWGTEKGPNNGNERGIYTREGTVRGYYKKVKLTMIVLAEGGVDPNPSIPTTPDGGDTGGDTGQGNIGNFDLGDDIYIYQGETYMDKLPSNIKDKNTNRNVAVTWTPGSIDTNLVDTEDVETSRVAAITFVGHPQGYNQTVRKTIIVRPRIASVVMSSLHITVSRSSLPGGVYTMPARVRVVLADGRTKYAKVESWNPPYVDAVASQTYYAAGRINGYDHTVTLVLRVTD